MSQLKDMSTDINRRFLAATTKFKRIPFTNKRRSKDPLYSREELQMIYNKQSTKQIGATGGDGSSSNKAIDS